MIQHFQLQKFNLNFRLTINIDLFLYFIVFVLLADCYESRPNDTFYQCG